MPGFCLLLNQPHRFSLQLIGLRHLEKRRLLEIAGHHTRVTRACSQMSQQCPETMYRQTLWCQVRPLLESHRLRSLGRRHRVAALPVLEQFLRGRKRGRSAFVRCPSVAALADASTTPGRGALLTPLVQDSLPHAQPRDTRRRNRWRPRLRVALYPLEPTLVADRHLIAALQGIAPLYDVNKALRPPFPSQETGIRSLYAEFLRGNEAGIRLFRPNSRLNSTYKPAYALCGGIGAFSRSGSCDYFGNHASASGAF
jgi:hypothetical protein